MSTPITTSIALLDAALRYARRGLLVLPLHSVQNGRCTCRKKHCESPGKHPRTSHGVFDATTDEATITMWWQRWPDANVGIATGKKSNIVAIDIDLQHGGEETLRAMEECQGPLPLTPETITGNGGRHVFFRYPAEGTIKNSAGKLGPGIDVRGEGGYVVAPPSIHTTGHRYTWEIEHLLEDIPLTGLPIWLLEQLLLPTIKPTADTAHTIPKGSRNATLTSLAGTMRRPGMTRSEVLAALEVVNRERCVPPLTVEEVCRIVDSISRYPSTEERDDAGDLMRMRKRTAEQNSQLLDDAALHGLAGDIARMLRPHTEADDVALLATFLSEFACIIGRAAYLVLEGCIHPLLLWMVLIGASAKSRKGSSEGRIRWIFQQADENWTRGEYRGTPSSGEGLAFAVRDPTYREESLKEQGQPTGQTVRLLSDRGVEDKRLFLVLAEFGGMLLIMGRDGNSLSSVMRDAWDGNDLAPMTKGNRIRATAPHIGIVGHITQAELQRNLTETDAFNGFGNRFIWLTVKRSKLLPFSSSPAPDELEPLIRRLRSAILFARTAGCLDFTASAKDAWAEIYGDLSRDRPGLCGSLLARAEAHVMRLAAVYALLDERRSIDVPHLTAAVALWQYSEGSAEELFGNSTGHSDSDAIIRALRQTDQLSDTQISNLFGRHHSQARLDHAKLTLQSAGLIHAAWIKTAGRPQRVWRMGEEPAEGSPCNQSVVPNAAMPSIEPGRAAPYARK
jgi:hypothetical protein